MYYYSDRSIWRSVLLIVALSLKLCKPQTRTDMTIVNLPNGGPQPADNMPGYTKPFAPTKVTRGDLEGDDTKSGGGGGMAGEAGHAAGQRFTTKTTTPKTYIRTTPMRVSFEENCDYLAHYCLKAYDTGKLCARTLYYGYYTFRNYCLLDFVNCMERFEVWQVVHMGECYQIQIQTEYLLYPYDDDYFLDQYYIMEDHK